jgi:hypothetical protein
MASASYMTAEQWFAATSPDPLLAYLDPQQPGSALGAPGRTPRAVARRLMLFTCACGRMVWEILPTNLCNAIEIRERFAEGQASEADLRAAAVPMMFGAATVKDHARNAACDDPTLAARGAAYALATRAAGQSPPGHPINRDWQLVWNTTFHAARATQAAILRDIFPPPGFRPHLHRDWLTSTVTAIARQMDATGDFSATPILADALQDSGCDDATVLQCCRGVADAHRKTGTGTSHPCSEPVPFFGVHVRGNWVVDLVLGRS